VPFDQDLMASERVFPARSGVQGFLPNQCRDLPRPPSMAQMRGREYKTPSSTMAN